MMSSSENENKSNTRHVKTTWEGVHSFQLESREGKGLAPCWEFVQKVLTRPAEQGFILLAEDEFPQRELLNQFLASSDVIHVGEVDQTFGYVIITPSSCRRTDCPVIADVRTLINPDLDIKELFGEFVKIGDKFAKQFGYEATIVQMFVTDLEPIGILKDIGYNCVGTIPLSAQIKSLGYAPSVLMYKEYMDRKTSPPPPDDLEDIKVKRAWPWNRTWTLDKVVLADLPLSHTLSDGTQLTVNYIQPCHVGAVRELYYGATTDGTGFCSIEEPEFPVEDSPDLEDTLEEFKCGRAYLGVFDQARPDDVVALCYVGPVYGCRSSRPKLADQIVIVSKEYRGKGLASFMMGLVKKLSKQLGYSAVLEDCFIDEAWSLRSFCKLGAAPVAYIPGAGYVSNKGWRDNILFYLNIV